ncbi:endonuclease domain-containing 1 protein [Microcaecilia unicolor]|uniref:Endonuclease domain-containing 1 protein n=1 Tax=Microcaecilia unicolor TaxID=1415580 RepID=A0A6P7XSP6_9AMPH|nr:endonuclease domain-containing 1 protein [Microcaecilia unicolor]
MKSVLVLAVSLLVHPLLLGARMLQQGEGGFAECNHFFPGEQPPEGFSDDFSVRICQMQGGEQRFATLYSTRDKIPVYSAFKYGEAAGNEARTWLIEPQLDDPDSSFGEVMNEADAANSVDGLGRQQALIEDYASSGYQPQPLNPSCIDKDNSQTATFTLTDAVPVMQGFAEDWSADVELIGKRLMQLCGDNLYFIAGAVPSDLKMKDKVSVPEFLWLAACCNTPEAWSMGFVKKMADKSSLESVTIEELEKRLPVGAQVFMSNCNGDSRTAEQQEIVQTISQLKSTQAMPTGPFFRTIQFIARILFGIVKSVFYVLWFIVKQFYNLVAGRLCSLWNGVTTYIGGISTVLFSIPYDILRVIGNVLCGIVKILNNVLTAVGTIVSVPVNFLLDIASFPVYTICAVPTVGKDIASGIYGSFSLIISAVVGLVDCSLCVVCYGLKRFIQRSLGQTESYDDS